METSTTRLRSEQKVPTCTFPHRFPTLETSPPRRSVRLRSRLRHRASLGRSRLRGVDPSSRLRRTPILTRHQRVEARTTIVQTSVQEDFLVHLVNTHSLPLRPFATRKRHYRTLTRLLQTLQTRLDIDSHSRSLLVLDRDLAQLPTTTTRIGVPDRKDLQTSKRPRVKLS